VLSDQYSDDLVTNVAASCPNTMVVLHTVGIRVLDPWITNPNVTAVIIAHLPGSDTGTALVQLLYGDQSPSGKLPYTIPKQVSDYPVVNPDVPQPDNLESPQSNFTEGAYIDYRAFDQKNIEPRFEFGFGLSYTTFEYSSLNIQMNDATPGTSDASTVWNQAAVVTVLVGNTGSVPGEEVAQLYIGIPNSPAKQLRGFDKAMIGIGASVTFVYELSRRDLSVWDTEQQAWDLQCGEYNVYVGSSSRDIRLTGKITIN
jgi:beta-glucosidase